MNSSNHRWLARVGQADTALVCRAVAFGQRYLVIRSFVRLIGRFGPHLFFIEMAAWLFYVYRANVHAFGRTLTGEVAAVGAALVTKALIDQIAVRVRRTRPFVRHGFAPLISKRADDPSFPSNHAGGAFALAVALGWWMPGLWGVSLLLAVLLAAARVYAGLHYVTDVIAGAVIGSLIALTLCTILSIA